MCSRCIMDTSDPGITFDSDGVCNHCAKHDELASQLPKSKAESEKRLQHVVDTMKAYGKNKPYDCLLGISGGVDSSYMAYLAHQYGLRPLVVHFDNGWNSEQAVQNIEQIVSRLGFDLQTTVMHWEEFKDLQRSFLKASVIDIELLSDNAIISTMFQLAKKNNIKYILSGHNVVTETHLPDAWTWMKYDVKNIKAIHKQFGQKKLKHFPLMNIFSFAWQQTFAGYQFIRFLDLAMYNKFEAIEVLKNELGWKEYGGKHTESIFTRFYQYHILPAKFHVDKRRSHLSSMVCSGLIDREQALADIQQPFYDEHELESDLTYVAKKLEFTVAELEEILRSPPKSHLAYPSELGVYNQIRKIKRLVYGSKTPGIVS
jgi:N-acetyl sugar amidotransferase